MKSSDLFSKRRGNLDGRYLLLCSLACCFALIAFTTFFPQYYRLWENFGIKAMSPSFADARVITAALESRREGFDVWTENPHDPWRRPFNYPRIWLLLGHAGVNQTHTAMFGLMMCFIFFACVWRVAGRLSFKEGVYYSLLIFSPATLLAVERGNIDLIIFGMLTAAILWLDLKNRYAVVVSAALITFAAFLKFFPIFAVSLFWALPRKVCLLATAACSVAFGFYLMLTAGDLLPILLATPRPIEIGYGSFVVVTRLLAYLPYDVPYSVVATLSNTALTLLLLSVYLCVKRSKTVLEDAPESSFKLNCFRVGTGIYFGTFLLGNNWDYRLIFLIFVVPQSLDWYSKQSPVRSIALTNLVCLLLALDWYLFSTETAGRHTLIKQCIDWLLLGGLLYLLFLSAPRWLKELLWLRKRNDGLQETPT